MGSADDLLDTYALDSQTKWLKSSCPSLFDESGSPNISYNTILSNDENYIVPDGLKYYDTVESGNKYVEELLSEEEKYLKEKYGPSLYNYFKTQRKNYIERQVSKVCDKYALSLKDGSETSELTNALDKQLESYYNYMNIYKEINKNIVEKTQSDSLGKRKIIYRSDALEYTNKAEIIMTYVYYFILFIFFCYISFTKKIRLRKKWWVYLTVIVLPLLFLKIYGLGILFYNNIRDSMLTHGPKNAFLNE